MLIPTTNLPFDASKFELHNIHRVQLNKSTGWYLKVQRNGKKLVKFYNDSLFDGPMWGLLTAISARDEFLKVNPKLPYNLHTIASNATGVNGVSFSEYDNAFVATWSKPDGGKVVKKFRVQVHGYHEALKAAIDARKAWEESTKEKVWEEHEQALKPIG